MEKTSFNKVSNLGAQGIKSNQVDQFPLSEEELSQQFPSLDHINISTQVFNLLNLINRLWSNRSSAFAANTHIPQPTDKQLIVALLNLGVSLNLVDAQKLLKFCRDDNFVEDGISFKRIHGCFENNPDVHGSITLDEFDAYINNQPGGDQIATLVENVVYNTPLARQIGVETLLRLLISSSKNIDYLKYLLEVVADFAFVENDPIDKQSMQKLAQQLDQHAYKQNDVIVALVNKIKSNIALPRAAIAHPEYSENRPQYAFQTNTNSNNPTQANPQPLANQPLITGEIPFDNRKDVLQQLRTYVPLNGALTANYELTNNNDVFPLVNKINEFIDDKNQAVLVILGDGGTGKSLFMQWLTTDLLNQRDNKKCFPLYVELSDVSDSNDILRQQFGLNSDALHELSSQYQIVLIADGFDQMPNKVNLYVENKLHKFNIKLIVSTRINTLPDAYLEFFNPRIVHKNQSSGMMQVYLQQFNSSQIDDYIANYIKENKSELEQQITLNQLTSQWLNPDYTKTQIQKITGLYELMHTPFMCSLILTEIPKLISMNQSRITTYQAYEIIIKGWISKQIINKAISLSVETVFEFAQKLAFTLQVDKMTEIDLSQISFYIDPESGQRKKAQDRWDWFKNATTIRLALPLELVKPNVHRFMHRSIQEFLVAHCLYTQLMNAHEFTNLDWNKIDLTSDNPTCYGIVSLLVDMMQVDELFKAKISKLSEQANLDQSQSIALTNTHLFMRKYSALYAALKDGNAVKVLSIVIRVLNDKSLSKNKQIDLLYAKDKDGTPGFFMVFANGHASAIKEFVTLILNADSSILSPSNKLELLLAKNKDGFPGFNVALQEGHAEAVKEFITLILNADSSILTPVNKLELLLAKDKDGTPGFFMALQNGYAPTIKEFITLVLNADSKILSPSNKLELLFAKASNGFPGFFMALQNGHASAIKKFVTLILNADSSILSPANRLELLLAKDNDGFPGVYVALQEGHAKAIREFITLILNADSSILSPANKLELLLAKASNGFSGFFMALQNGHAPAIKEFVTLILDADNAILTLTNKLELLLAKRSDGVPGFLMALRNGHAPAIKEFITLILNTADNILTSANKLELLLAKASNGDPGFYVALGNGRAPAIKEFITLILNADSSILSTANKLELLLAKASNGYPGFLMALRNGHAPAIKEFITLILNAYTENYPNFIRRSIWNCGKLMSA